MVHLTTASPNNYEGQMVIVDPNYVNKNKPEQMIAVVIDASNPNYTVIEDGEGGENTHHNSQIYDLDSTEAAKIISKYQLEEYVEEFEDNL